MQLTHEQAHKLIQRNTDKDLSSHEATALFAHLRDCTDCQTYADEIKEVELLLFPLLKKQWNRQPIPLTLTALAKKSQRTQVSLLLTTRKAAIGVAIVTLFFSIWQFVSSGPSTSNPLPLIVPAMPTPSVQTTQSTTALAAFENCELVLYPVQGDDTLARIADQFSVSKEDIMAINSLQTESIDPSMELAIPVCNFTPTGTVRPATFTTTYTPVTRPTTSTPDG
jgi:hypothetical protein